MSIMKRGRFWALSAATTGIVGALVACGDGGDGSQVTASDATNKATVAIAMLDINGTEIGGCSGTLIGPTTVLTAGHCVSGKAAWRITAPNSGTAGAVNGYRGVTYDWQQFGSSKSHPMHNDVALVYLDKPIVLQAYPKLALSSAADGTILTRFRRAELKNNAAGIRAMSGAAYHGKAKGFANAYTTELAPGEDLDTGGALMDTETNTIYAVISAKGLTTNTLYASRVDNSFRWSADKLSCHTAKAGVTAQSIDVLCKTDAGAKKPSGGGTGTGTNGGSTGSGTGTGGGTKGGTNGGSTGGGAAQDCDIELPGGLFGLGGASVSIGPDGTISFPGGSYGPGTLGSGTTPPNGGPNGTNGGATTGGTHGGSNGGGTTGGTNGGTASNGGATTGSQGSGTTPPTGGTNGGFNGSYGPGGGTVAGGGGCWGLCPGLEGPYSDSGMTPPTGGTNGGTNGSYGPGGTNGGSNGGGAATTGGASSGTTPPNGSTGTNGSYGPGANGTTDGACMAGPDCGGCVGNALCVDDTVDYGDGPSTGAPSTGGQVPIK